MSGEHVSLGGEPGGTAMHQRAHGDGNTGQLGTEQPEPSSAGSIRRLIRRTGLLTLVIATFAALAAWVTLLALGGLWIWNQLPLV